MSKGKNKKNGKTSFKVALGFDNFTGEKTNFTVGITLFILSIVMIICFISYFSTADADQSLLEHPMPGDFVNKQRVFQNICGSWGAYTSYFRPCISEYLRLLGSLHIIFLYSTLFWISGSSDTGIFDDSIVQNDWCL